MKILPILVGICLMCSSSTFVDYSHHHNNNNSRAERLEFGEQKNPRVFLIDENELLFEELSEEYKTLMIAACKNDINLASREWLKTLISMQAYAARWEYYDAMIGVKIWIKVFCDKRGRIQHIAYAVKPGSRNVDTQVFSAFLERFLRVHRMDIRSKSKFSHYTSVTFPVKIKK